MRTTNSNNRRDFLRKIPIALVSFSALSIFKFKKSKSFSEIKYNTLSKTEADEIIKNEKFTASERLEPAPAPATNKYSTG